MFSLSFLTSQQTTLGVIVARSVSKVRFLFSFKFIRFQREYKDDLTLKEPVRDGQGSELKEVMFLNLNNQMVFY